MAVAAAGEDGGVDAMSVAPCSVAGWDQVASGAGSDADVDVGAGFAGHDGDPKQRHQDRNIGSVCAKEEE